jgi:hypothetical protein
MLAYKKTSFSVIEKCTSIFRLEWLVPEPIFKERIMPSGLQVIYAREELPGDFFYQDSVFLMGPTPRSPEISSWRPAAIRRLGLAGFDGYVLIPEDRPDPDGKTRFRGDWDDQIDWESIV